MIDSWARGIVTEVSDLPEVNDEVTTISTTSLDHQVTLHGIMLSSGDGADEKCGEGGGRGSQLLPLLYTDP